MASYTIDAPENVQLDRANIVGVRPAYDGKELFAHIDRGNSSVVLYTVPVDYVLLLMNSAVRVVTVSSNIISSTVYVRNGAANVMYALGWADIQAAYVSQHIVQHFNPPMHLPAGYDIFVQASGAGSLCGCSIYGILQKI